MGIALSDIRPLVEAIGVAVFDGYARSGAKVPYVVQRPMLINYENLALNGSAIDWDNQFNLYACGGSVEASFNLAKEVIAAVHGERVGGSTLAASMGYSGAPVEGHYETEVTVQINTGGI
jgi:hypothetical protein